MSSLFAKSAIAAASAALLCFSLIGCASEPAAGEGATSDGDRQPTEVPSGGDGDYAFGSDRDNMITAIETAFSTDNATARWDGDRLVLTLDGDINDVVAGFTHCRVLSLLLLETDAASIEFPNGSITCEEALAE